MQKDSGLLIRNMSKVHLLFLIGVLQRVLCFDGSFSDEYHQIVVKKHKIIYHTCLQENFVKCFVASECGIHDMSMKKFKEAKWRLKFNKALYVIKTRKRFQKLFSNSNFLNDFCT